MAAFYAIDPVVLLAGLLMNVVLMAGLLLLFIALKYFHYKDLKLLLNAFVALGGVIVLTVASVLTIIFSVPLNPYFNVAAHVLGGAAAWLLAFDAYRMVRK